MLSNSTLSATERPAPPAVDINSPEFQAQALRWYSRLTDLWSLSLREAAELADMSKDSFKRVRQGSFAGRLTRDQMLRLSALIGIFRSLEINFPGPLAREWVSRPNDGVMFGGKRPLDTMIEKGLPLILRVRNHLDALRGGA